MVGSWMVGSRSGMEVGKMVQWGVKVLEKLTGYSFTLSDSCTFQLFLHMLYGVVSLLDEIRCRGAVFHITCMFPNVVITRQRQVSDQTHSYVRGPPRWISKQLFDLSETKPLLALIGDWQRSIHRPADNGVLYGKGHVRQARKKDWMTRTGRDPKGQFFLGR